MMRLARKTYALRWASIAFHLALFFTFNLCAESRRPIAASDCVTVRRFPDTGFHSAIQLDPQGKRAAYLVQSPNLQSNTNDIVLEVASLDHSEMATSHLLVGRKISEPRWMDRGESIVVLAPWQGRVSVIKVAVPSGRTTLLARAAEDIVEYSIAADGRTIVYAVEQPMVSLGTSATPEEEARGYRITMDKPSVTHFPERQLFVVRKADAGWTSPKQLSLQLPSMREAMRAFPYAIDLRLSVSPDGKHAAFTFLTRVANVPDRWQQSSFVRTISTRVGLVQMTPVINLEDGASSLPFEGPWAYSVPLWSPDSRSFVIVAISPAGSVWENEDVARQLTVDEAVHLFEVVPAAKTQRLVQSDLHASLMPPLHWSSDDDVLVRGGAGTLLHYRRENGVWGEVSQERIRIPHQSDSYELASDGRTVVGDYETPATPPSFFIYRAGQPTFERLVTLNPQFDGLTLAPTRALEWKTSTGYRASGLLFLPPDYDSHKSYPLVIHAYPAASNFFCDSGKNHEPSFAPQPLANAGIMYLIRTVSGTVHGNEEQTHYPKGFPGALGEAAFQTDIWDSAVEQLAKEGLVDPARVGIVGFSRSGWYTEFALTHARTHFAAATVADNAQYSLGEYLSIHSESAFKGVDAMYGGPPYGDTLQGWIDHSISFNLPKIQAPLLMEIMGYGKHYRDGDTVPTNLALKWEIFAGLNHLGKPVEMYYYPLETHQPENPVARFSSLDRNVAWFSFWLEGVERPDPTDPERFVRWRALREAQRRGSTPPEKGVQAKEPGASSTPGS